MTRFLLDTNMAGHYINRRHGVFDRARLEVANGNPIGIGVPVLAELVAGVEHSSSRERNMKRLRTAITSLRLWSGEVGRIARGESIVAARLRLSFVERPLGPLNALLVQRSCSRNLGLRSNLSAIAIPGIAKEPVRRLS